MNKIHGFLFFMLFLFPIHNNIIFSSQSIDAQLELTQNENHIVVTGSIGTEMDANGLKVTLDILGDDGRHMFTLLDVNINLDAHEIRTLKDMNNGEDVEFSLEYLYGTYVVLMRITGYESGELLSLQEEFQTELLYLHEELPLDDPDTFPFPVQNTYDLPCCSEKIIRDLDEYFEFNWTEEKIISFTEIVKNEIYPEYDGGFSDLAAFFADMNISLNLQLTETQINSLIDDIESGKFAPEHDAAIPEISQEIMEQLAAHPSDSSAPFCTGKNVIVRIYVNDPQNVWNYDDMNTAWQQVILAANQITNLAPESAQVSFNHVSLVSTLTDIPVYNNPNDNEKRWMKDAINVIGYPDTTEFAKAIKTSFDADNVILLFLPHTDGVSYALPYPGWGYGERTCVFFYYYCFIVCIKNDEGPYKHEMLHLYGACDEYGESQCNCGCGQCYFTYDSYKYLYLNSGNCEYCTSSPVPCVMRSGVNDHHDMNDYICSYTRGQIGWGDYDGDFILDPFDLCPSQSGPSDMYGCPSFGFGNLHTYFSSEKFHVVGDQAKCTDVLGTANISWILGRKYMTRPEGKTDALLTGEEHDNDNLIIMGGPAINPLASEFDSCFGITYYYDPNPPNPLFRISAEGKMITLNINDYYSPQKEDICIVYFGRHNYRSILIIWGYGWEGTYAGSLFMSVPYTWIAYAQDHLLLLRWKDINMNGQIEFSEIHPENIAEIPVTPPPPGTPQLVNPVFRNMHELFAGYAFHVVGDQAKCTDVLGTANMSWAFGIENISRPEGKTDAILTSLEHDTGHLLLMGGPAINPLADEFNNRFNITYTYVPDVTFTIHCQNENRSIYLNLNTYPGEDICLVYLNRYNNQAILSIWGYGWRGTYAGSIFMSDFSYWTSHGDYHLLLLRWKDSEPYDGYVQTHEIQVEGYA
jgi:hypothetical protein